MENKRKREIIDPYKEETRTFFAMRETLMQRKKTNMTEEEAKEFNLKFKNISRAERLSKIKKDKSKKEKKIKVKKEKKQKVKTEVNYLFKLTKFNLFPRFLITTLLIVNTIIFSSFVDSNGYKFVIFYNNGIDVSDGIANAVFYLSIIFAIAYNGYAFVKSINISIYKDGSVILKSFDNNIKGNINELHIRIDEHKKYFNIQVGEKEIKNISNKYLSKLKSSILVNDNDTTKMV